MDEPLNDHQRLALEGLERMLREQLPKGPEWQRDYIRRSRSYFGRRPMTKAERLEELDALCARFLAAQEWIKQQGRRAGDQPVPPVAAELPPEKAIGARLAPDWCASACASGLPSNRLRKPWVARGGRGFPTSRGRPCRMR